MKKLNKNKLNYVIIYCNNNICIVSIMHLCCTYINYIHSMYSNYLIIFFIYIKKLCEFKLEFHLVSEIIYNISML